MLPLADIPEMPVAKYACNAMATGTLPIFRYAPKRLEADDKAGRERVFTELDDLAGLARAGRARPARGFRPMGLWARLCQSALIACDEGKLGFAS